MRISLEGNISAGKSAILDALRESFPELECFPEPIDGWGDLLALFYNDKKTWALSLSLKVLLGFRASNESKMCIVERSPLACKHVFTKLLHQDGTLSQEQWTVFNEYFDIIGWAPDVVVYIDTPASVCMERLVKRSRPCEQTVDLQYLKQLAFAYETMIKQQPRVLRIDGNQPLDLVVKNVVEGVRRLIMS